MTISIWRYSHLALAVSSLIFIVIASVTGIILAFEPVSNQLKPFVVKNAEKQTVANTITTLKNTFDEVVELTIDTNGFVSADVITKNGESGVFYINPKTGDILGKPIEKAPIFKFATNLHRSLFLKKTGRFLVGLASLLLFLIAVSGIKLVIKRQGSFKKFFSKIVKDDFYQFNHIVFGRLSLIPIVILTLTGVYLSLEKFDALPKHSQSHNINFDTITSQPKTEINEFSIFNNIQLKDVKRIEFPFSTDVEDYYTLELKDRDIAVNQITGEVLSQVTHPLTKIVSYYSLILHTGQGTIVWSLVLCLSCIGILFFIYSGFKIALARRKKSKLPKNTITKDEAEFIILVGSENGNTFSFSNTVFSALQEAKHKVFISELNDYDLYKNAKHLVIFTSTYGEGEAPSNASKYIEKLNTISQTNTIKYSVVGFGSLLYPDFCQYAIDVDETLQKHSSFSEAVALHKINNQSLESFKLWINEWREATKLDVNVKMPVRKTSTKKHKPFKVVYKSKLNVDDTYLLQLRPEKKQRFKSGDLLSYIPKVDGIERLYSIAKYKNDILLSIKKQHLGVVSTLFSELETNAVIKARVKKNPEFYLPSYAKNVLLISNGTGIAPFLGMIENASIIQNIHLFWGGRTKASLKIYKPFLDANKLVNNFIAYSQEDNKQYVQDVLKTQSQLVEQIIKKDGVIMICGSVAMQNKVLNVIENICKTKLNITLSDLEINEQLKMDCY